MQFKYLLFLFLLSFSLNKTHAIISVAKVALNTVKVNKSNKRIQKARKAPDGRTFDNHRNHGKSAKGALDTRAVGKHRNHGNLAEGANVTKSEGRLGKQARLHELANDPKLGKADKGWIKQEQNSIARGNRKTIRNPPGKDLAHERGREAAKGYGYEHSNLQDRKLHRLQHKYDNFGRKNKEMPPRK